MRAAPRLPRKSPRSSCGLQGNLVSLGLQFAHPPIFILRCAPQRMPTRLGACAWTVASANKRREKSRRGTHECVRHACADGPFITPWGTGLTAEFDKIKGYGVWSVYLR